MKIKIVLFVSLSSLLFIGTTFASAGVWNDVEYRVMTSPIDIWRYYFHKRVNKHYWVSGIIILESKISAFVNNTFPFMTPERHNFTVWLIGVTYLYITCW
jgi:hypothetical protein